MHDATEVRGKPRLLIVEDDDALRGQMRWALAGEYDVLVAGDRASALAAMGQVECAVVTLDLGLPPCSRGVEEGFATLAAIAEQHPAAKVVVITGREEREHALAAVGRGAYDYFCKPVDIGELRVVLRRAFTLCGLEQENRAEERRLAGAVRRRELSPTHCRHDQRTRDLAQCEQDQHHSPHHDGRPPPRPRLATYSPALTTGCVAASGPRPSCTAPIPRRNSPSASAPHTARSSTERPP